jgi:16S rRNA (adenine1518-N6/adenine1519-N6)-dimethyltransferase
LLGHRPRKRFGQHFLAPGWASKVVAAIAPEPGDVFLEIGPGRGALTLPLASTGAPILAVEIDRDLARALAAEAPRNVTVMQGDVLKTDVVPYLSGLEPQRSVATASGPGPARRVRIIGNLPYNLTSPIFYRLAELQEQHRLFDDATVMVQREVADRLAAKPRSRDYGVLTVSMALVGQITRLLDLPPGAFRPAPKVRSSVVRLTFGPPPVRVPDPAFFVKVVKQVFGQRRKMVGNGLKGLVPHPADVLRAAGIDADRRPETLTFAEFARLAGEAQAAMRPVL